MYFPNQKFIIIGPDGQLVWFIVYQISYLLFDAALQDLDLPRSLKSEAAVMESNVNVEDHAQRSNGSQKFVKW